MKYIYSLFLIFSIVSFSQNKQTIDSVNTIPFKIRLEKACVLDSVFLKNVKNAKKINYKLGEGESYSNLALINYYQGNFQKDLVYSQKAISIYEKINATEKLALEYGELGFRMKKRNLNKALFYLQKGKKIAENNNFQKPLLSIYNNYGVLKEMQHQNDSALFFYNKGLSLKEKIKDSVGLPYSLNNIAGIYVKQKLFSKALINYERAKKIRVLLNDEIGITENYTYLGDLYFAQKKYAIAIDNYKIALEKALKFKYLDLTQYCYEMLSKNYECLNDTNQALKNYKLFSIYKDSLLNKDTNSKIAELDVKFETAKKEKQLLQNEIEAKKRNYIILGLLLLAAFISLVGYLIYRQQKLKNKQQTQSFELKQAITQIETQNKLQSQRLSISKDLHDNIGAQLTFIISAVETAKFAPEVENTKLGNKLTQISDFTKDTIVELRDTIWAMNSNEITFEDLKSRILNFIEKANSAAENIAFKFIIDESLNHKELSSIVGMNIYRTIQEAINNALKYANATQISVEIKNINNQIVIEVLDNGNGFEINNIVVGNGLNNMQKRIEEIGGTFNLTSKIGKGTQISILI